jgi:hypothetical protein
VCEHQNSHIFLFPTITISGHGNAHGRLNTHGCFVAGKVTTFPLLNLFCTLIYSSSSSSLGVTTSYIESFSLTLIYLRAFYTLFRPFAKHKCRRNCIYSTATKQTYCFVYLDINLVLHVHKSITIFIKQNVDLTKFCRKT